jgi:hypothetical protein
MDKVHKGVSGGRLLYAAKLKRVNVSLPHQCSTGPHQCSADEQDETQQLNKSTTQHIPLGIFITISFVPEVVALDVLKPSK